MVPYELPKAFNTFVFSEKMGLVGAEEINLWIKKHLGHKTEDTGLDA